MNKKNLTAETIWELINKHFGDEAYDIFYAEVFHSLNPDYKCFHEMAKLKYEDGWTTQELCNHFKHGVFTNIGNWHQNIPDFCREIESYY